MTASDSRSGLMRRAIVTGLSGKGVGVLTQLLAIPLAIGALGIERYGAYAMLTAVLLWANMLPAVVANAFSLKLVSAHAANDRRMEARLFSTTFFFAVVAAALLWLLMHWGLAAVDPRRLFAIESPTLISDLRAATAWMAWLLPLSVVLSLGEAAHNGYQRQYINNLFTIGANLATLAALLWVVRWHPSIEAMVLAMFLPVSIGRFLNLAMLLHGRRYLLPSWAAADFRLLGSLLVMGAAFGLTQAGGFVYQQFPTFYIGREASLTDAAYFATMMTVIAISGNLLIMFTQPLMPALRDAVARHDNVWIRGSHRLILRRVVPYISLASFVIALGGSQLASTLTRHSTSFDVWTLCLWAAFFWIVAWEHIHYSFLVGLGQIWTAASLYVLGASLMLAVSLVAVPAHGIAGAFAAMCLGPLLCTVVAYPIIIQRRLNRLALNSNSLAPRVRG